MFKYQAEPKTILKSNVKNELNKIDLKNKSPIFISIGNNKLEKILKSSSDEIISFHYDKPNKAIYVPLPPKINIGTQIYYRDWFLFNYDQEVLPVLQIMVAKILNLSLIEIKKEFEIIKNTEIKKDKNVIRNAGILKTIRIQNKNERFLNEINFRSREEYFREIKNKNCIYKNVSLKNSSLLINKIFQNYLINNYNNSNNEINYINGINIYLKNYKNIIENNIKEMNNFEDYMNNIFNKVKVNFCKIFNKNVDKLNKLKNQKLTEEKIKNENIKEIIKKEHNMFINYNLSINLKKIKFIFKNILLKSESISIPNKIFDIKYFSLTEFAYNYIPLNSYFGLIFPLWQYIFYFIKINNDNFDDILLKLDELLNLNEFTILISASEQFNIVFNEIEIKIVNNGYLDQKDIDILINILINYYYEKESYNLIDKEFCIQIFKEILNKKLYLLIKPKIIQNNINDVEINETINLENEILNNKLNINDENSDFLSNNILIKNQEIYKKYSKINFLINNSVSNNDNKYLININLNLNNEFLKNSYNEIELKSLLNQLKLFNFKSSLFNIKKLFYNKSENNNLFQLKSYYIKQHNNFIINNRDKLLFFNKLFDSIKSYLKITSEDEYNSLIENIINIENKFLSNIIIENIDKNFYIFDYEFL